MRNDTHRKWGIHLYFNVISFIPRLFHNILGAYLTLKLIGMLKMICCKIPIRCSIWLNEQKLLFFPASIYKPSLLAKFSSMRMSAWEHFDWTIKPAMGATKRLEPPKLKAAENCELHSFLYTQMTKSNWWFTKIYHLSWCCTLVIKKVSHHPNLV